MSLCRIDSARKRARHRPADRLQPLVSVAGECPFNRVRSRRGVAMQGILNRSLVRLELRAGALALHERRLVQIEERLDSNHIYVRDVATGERYHVAIGDLEGRDAIAAAGMADELQERVRSDSDPRWQKAVTREQALRRLLTDSEPAAERIKNTAQGMQVSTRTVYRWLARYRDLTQTSSLIAYGCGVKPGTSRLDIVREQLVRTAINEHFLTCRRPSVEEIVRIVQRRCIERGLQPASRNAIRLRVERLEPRSRTKARYGTQEAKRRHALTPGQFEVSAPLESVQIAYALGDIIVVDERDREAIGRPWITLAIDVFSRAVLGFYVSLDPPSVTAIALCLTQACLPKERWLAVRDLNDIT
jgi:putative transposase